MDAVERAQDRASSTGERPFGADNFNEQKLLAKDEGSGSSNPSGDVPNIVPSRDNISGHKPSVSSGDISTIHPFVAQGHYEQTANSEGYENTSSTWSGYPHFPVDNIQVVPPVIYNDNSSLMFHPDFGFNSQMAYGQYSPVATPLPSIVLDGQLYSPQQMPFPPYYPQPFSPVSPHVSSTDPLAQTDLMVSENGGRENIFFGPGSGYYVHYGSFSGGDISGTSGFYNLPGEFASVQPLPSQLSPSTASWSMPTLPSPESYTSPIGMLGSYDHGLPQQIPPQPNHQHGFGLVSTPYSNHYLHEGSYSASNFGTLPTTRSRANDRSRLAPEKGRRRERDRDPIPVSCDVHDMVSDRNRGPRASKIKSRSSPEKSASNGTSRTSSSSQLQSYNNIDFPTTYENAKFFIIKSFSEDNVHKSIKYGVWASTALGNGKLDAAFSEAKEMGGSCPVFLFFSVNASSQFCGAAEMVGPVDFENNAEYWQQDRWSGQFPVKWHIIKDVPNSRFRHILLENNENKPVTHSRDCQEVRLELGCEMLKIFKDYDARTSILDDFVYYDEKERVLQERKVRQQAVSIVDASVSVSEASVHQLSSSLAEKLQVEEKGKEVQANEKNS